MLPLQVSSLFSSISSTISSTIPSTGKQCSICGSSSHGLHFGAISCRACAAFFKRSVDMRRVYNCRRSGGKCDLTLDVRCICRACRFSKCLAMGMSLGGRGSPSDTQSPSSSGVVASPPDSDTFSAQFDTLTRVADALHRLHQTFLIETPHIKRPLSVTFDLVTEYSQQYVDHLPAFIKAHYPYSEDFTENEMNELCKNYAIKFIFFESGSHSAAAKSFDKIVFHDGNYIDINDLEHYFSTFKVAQFTPKDAARVHHPSFTRFVKTLTKPLSLLDMNDIEKAALILLIFFEPGIPSLTKETDEKVMRGRDLALKELTMYYKQTARSADFPIRMARLMMVIPCLERVVDTFKEDMRINKLFGEVNEESLLMLAGF
ncbi:unnamed protein product, partial [Mesorhabditis belari]|uniref:Uncharacterized protein n=1 Tax=Mesorhabditis belari TaxID=2138241 RepID=A0AAF3JC03_9BILA